MYSVLVADDNSNIQKMVALALKDEGIEVIAVGNGEAAVRKLSDVRPDLILADIFMPVRNGYEVCEFVKKDERLSGIPVILLVGAFDPLDDEEVRRVGADGVLKKPFVPPEPLISLVKATLDKLPKKEPEPQAASREIAMPPPPVPVAQPAPPPFSPPELEAEPEPEEFTVGQPRVAFGVEEGALAFGSLLEPQAPAEEESAEAEPSSFAASSLEGVDIPLPAEPEELPAWRRWSFEPAAGKPETPQHAESEAMERKRSVEYFAPSARVWGEPAEEAAPPTEAAPPPEPPPVAAAPPPSPVSSEPLIATLDEEDLHPSPVDPAASFPMSFTAPPPPPPVELEHAPEPPAPTQAPSPTDAELIEQAVASVLSQRAPVAPEPEPPKAQPVDPAVVENVVDQLVAKLRPQIEQVTREMLRPVAESLLQRELEKSDEKVRR